MVTQVASDIEIIVIRWLDNRGIQYEFQSSLMGGFFELGGAVVDILIPDRRLAWRIFGEYWHRGVEPEARDMVQRELLAGEGWTVIDLWGDDIKERTNETLNKALRGESMLR